MSCWSAEATSLSLTVGSDSHENRFLEPFYGDNMLPFLLGPINIPYLVISYQIRHCRTSTRGLALNNTIEQNNQLFRRHEQYTFGINSTHGKQNLAINLRLSSGGQSYSYKVTPLRY
jgi:hypothetical protein